MIRVFGQTDTDFSSNGDVVLNPFKAKIHKEDNGDFYLDLELPLEHEEYLTPGNIVVANTPQGDQAFRIGNITKTRRKITTKCWHVFYDTLYHMFVSEITNATPPAETCASMLNRLNTSLAVYPASDFTITTDITGTSIFSAKLCTFYDALMSIVNKFNGHLVRDNWNIAVNSSIGEDKGVTIRYGSNLKDISRSENWDDVCTRIYPLGKDGTRLQGAYYIDSATQYTLKYTKTVSFSQDNIKREYYDTQADYQAALNIDLLSSARAYLDEHCVPEVNYTMSAIPEVVSDIGDTFRVVDELLGVDILASVKMYEYDCITERYLTLEFGNKLKSAKGMGRSLSRLVSLQTGGFIGDRQLTFSDGGTVSWVDV